MFVIQLFHHLAISVAIVQQDCKQILHLLCFCLVKWKIIDRWAIIIMIIIVVYTSPEVLTQSMITVAMTKGKTEHTEMGMMIKEKEKR
ncbi:hypothetical protein T02_2663 [Trichinella nativa]|uniref:Uncharacterized protein n=1 Tax=Trichinella nativa TaxID=6335 RepID=A0A0V1LU86_9BILA|nr:hypothetical protein T02_2663 [Trichinella nativa]KRZ90680.1 hypothetical protein T08_1025 [Trichinella sp. T8]